MISDDEDWVRRHQVPHLTWNYDDNGVSSQRTLKPTIRRLIPLRSSFLYFSMFEKLAEDYAKCKRYVKWLYLLYELNTQIAICEPWEKVFLNVLLGSCMSLILYASFAYVPGYCLSVFHLLWPLAGVQNLTTGSVCTANIDGFCGNESGAVL